MGKVKYILLGLFVLLVAGVIGAVAAISYQDTRAMLQEERDKRDAIAKEKREQQEAKEAALKKKKEAREKRRSDKEFGVEHPDEVIRGLIADMQTETDGSGAAYYRYDATEEEGVFLSASLRNSGGTPMLYGVLRYNGINQEPSNSIHVRTDVGEYDIDFALSSIQGNTESDKDGTVLFEQPVDKGMEEALRAIGISVNAKVGLPGGSENDRNLTATEIYRIKNMIDLYDIMRGAKSTE